MSHAGSPLGTSPLYCNWFLMAATIQLSMLHGAGNLFLVYQDWSRTQTILYGLRTRQSKGHLTLADLLRSVAVSLDISTMATLRFTRSAYTFINPMLLITASTYRAGMQGQQSLFSQLRGFGYCGGTSGAFSSFILCGSITLVCALHGTVLALPKSHANLMSSTHVLASYE